MFQAFYSLILLYSRNLCIAFLKVLDGMVLEVKMVAYICFYLVKHVTSVMVDPGVELLCCEIYILFFASSTSYQVDYVS